MAVIFPAHCRGVTAGALRQIREDGFTTNSRSGGLGRKDYLVQFLLDSPTLLRKTEPLGEFMTSLEQANQEREKMTEALSKTTKELVEQAQAGSKALSEASASIRQATDKMAGQMQRFHNTFQSTKFGEQADAIVRLADAMERLAALEERGMLARIFGALDAGPATNKTR